jgi:para-nitrobenzyl esterase
VKPHPFHPLRTILLSAVAPSLAAVAGVAPGVATVSGRVRGAELDGALAFKGIPFAAPPVGDLRWRPPQPPRAWDGVRACTNFAPACPQPSDMTYGFAYKPQSEDCLYLNLWTPGTNGAPRPVMVWIHGGGNTIGGANSPIYDGRHFAASGVVLVSIQYRLGAFGYLAHPALTAEAKALDGRASSGNYGLMDQIAALQWVQRNIAAFGGDTNRVTIFGESAGAANVTHLMASPLAKGLFHRVIAQSGYFGESTPDLDHDRSPAVKSAHATGLEFGKAMGASGDDAAALKALRALPPEKLLSVPFAIGSLRSGGGGEDGPRRPFRLGPVVDGHVLPEEPGAVWAAGRMHKVPLMAGSLLDDGSVFSRANPIRKQLGYRLALRTIFGEDADRAREIFPVATDDEVHGAVHRITTILSFRAPARRLVRWMESAGGDAWLYHFARNPRSGRSAREGVFHGLEIGYAFKTLAVLGDATDRAVADDMHRRWTNFATTGDPNRGPDGAAAPAPEWPKYAKDSDRHLDFGNRITAGTGLDRAACDLADSAAARRRGSSQ